jgi:hypothetical protein
VNISQSVESEIANLFSVTLEDVVWIRQENSEFEDKLDAIFKWEDAAKVPQPGMSEADALPARIGLLSGLRRDCAQDIAKLGDDFTNRRRIVAKEAANAVLGLHNDCDKIPFQ